MTERTCEQCGKHLITHRRGARFCGDGCKNAWHNKHRRSGSTTDKRFTPVEGGVGARGGNVRSVSEARQLQTASKALDRWRLVMEVHIHRTLLATGHFHVDDLDCLDLPPAAFAVRGTLVNAVRAAGVMQSTGVTRKVAHKAANARKAPIYEITPKGREQLPKLVGLSSGTFRGVVGAAESGEEQESVGLTAAAEGTAHPRGRRSGEPGDTHPGVGSPAGVTKSGSGPPPTAAGTGRPSSLVQLDGARKAPSMFDPWSDAA